LVLTFLISACAALALLFGIAEGQTTPQTPQQKKPQTLQKKAKVTPHKTASPATTKKGTQTATIRTRRPVAAVRQVRQQTPSTQRYSEIQQALADKGYYKGPVNGQWGPESVESLKRFQADQKLESDGKLGSLSLIALGLGPQHTASAQVPSGGKPSTESSASPTTQSPEQSQVPPPGPSK